MQQLQQLQPLAPSALPQFQIIPRVTAPAQDTTEIIQLPRAQLGKGARTIIRGLIDMRRRLSWGAMNRGLVRRLVLSGSRQPLAR